MRRGGGSGVRGADDSLRGEGPFLLPAMTKGGQRRLRWAERDGYHFVDLTVENVGLRPAVLGDIQLSLNDVHLIYTPWERTLLQPNESVDKRVQSSERVRSGSERSGAELRVYYRDLDGTPLMTRSRADLGVGGIDCKSFIASRSDGHERPFTALHERDRALDDLIDEFTALDLAGEPITDSDTLTAVEVSLAEISDSLLRTLAAHPELLHTLHWRKFEELVAELLNREGFDVTLTSASGDRGVDIYALRHEGFGRFLYVVECKRQAPDRMVGPGLVRHLYGVVEREKATHGLLATTSFFTRGAVAEQRDVRFRVSLRDFHAIQAWLRRT